MNLKKKMSLLVMFIALSQMSYCQDSSQTREGGESSAKVGLAGYCPVAYAKMGKAVPGDAKFASEHKGIVYHSSSAEAKKMFDKEPDTYISAMPYKTWCATGVAMGKKLESDYTLYTKIGDKVYFFSSADAKKMFDKDSKGLIKKADAAWPALDI